MDAFFTSCKGFDRLYGFSAEEVKNINNYTNIRKYHNLVKTQSKTLSGIFPTRQERFEKKRSEDVRFHNIDEVSYAYENYENWLKE